MRKILTGSLVLLFSISGCTNKSASPPLPSPTPYDESGKVTNPSPSPQPETSPNPSPDPQASASPTPSPVTSPSPNPQKKTAETETVSRSQQAVIDDLMANHSHRLYHALWHSTRNVVSYPNMKVVKKLSPLWGKHAPVCNSSGWARTPDTIGVAGEEFLFMHRGMMEMLNVELAARNLPGIKAWKEIPDPSDRNWPMPQASDQDDFSKDDQTFLMMKQWEKVFRDPEYLKGKSLSWIGYILEFSLHNLMHARWSGPVDPQVAQSPLSTGRGKKLSLKGLLDPWPYDAPEYNWLGSPYSAHVNPVFWKLHGFVDETIPAWLSANGYDSIAVDCKNVAKCYEWKSTWVGEMPPDPAQVLTKKNKHAHHHMRMFASVDGDDPDAKQKADEQTVAAAQSMSNGDVKSVGDLLQKGNFRSKGMDEFMKKNRTAATNAMKAPQADSQAPQAPTNGAAFQPVGLNDPAIFIQQFRLCQ